MALPKWITPAGNLGIVPELEYYEYKLDAYDASGGTLVYSFISGELPPGIQLATVGKLQGIPVSTTFNALSTAISVAPDLNQTYTFTIRVTNTSDGYVSDRSFDLTITNVAPPIINPKNVVVNTKLRIAGSTITANIGDYITQSVSKANALVVSGIVNSPTVTVSYLSGSPQFTIGSGNLSLLSGNIGLYPDINDTGAYPVSSQSISSLSTRNLGLYFDGDVINLQLAAIEFIPGAPLTWRLKSGTIPNGLTLDSSGLLSGYIEPILATGPSSNPGWDDTPWDEKYLTGINNGTATLGWDFPLGTTSKPFTFVIEVTDGVSYDQCSYEILVMPRGAFRADGTLITIDTTLVEGIKLTVDIGPKHFPIILSTQLDIPAERQNGWFSYHIDAIDLDGDTLFYSIPQADSGTFDEQLFSGESVPYIAAPVINGRLESGVFPKITQSNLVQLINLFSGNVISVHAGDYITQPTSGANAQITSSGSGINSIAVTNLTTTNFSSGSGNLWLNGVNLTGPTGLGIYPQSIITNSAETFFDYTSAGLLPNDHVQVLQSYLNPSTEQSTFAWYDATITHAVSVELTGNTILSSNVGDYLTQSVSGANMIVTSISETTGTIYLGGKLISGTLTTAGNLITASPGDLITQPDSGAVAAVAGTVVSASIVPIVLYSGTFSANILNPANLQINGSNIASYPISSTAGSSLQQTIVANAGDVITQPGTGAIANVLYDVLSGTSVSVKFFKGSFATGANSGNLLINSSNTLVYASTISAQTIVDGTYINDNTFVLNLNYSNNIIYSGNGITSHSTGAIPTSITGVGVSINGLETQGVIGYDEGKFDQGVLTLPGSVKIDPYSGWMTGRLPNSPTNELNYNFEIQVSKFDYPEYARSKLFSLQILGDLNNTIDWLTPSYLGTIENGKISDLYIEAISSKGKTLYYTLTPGAFQRLPQGLELTTGGLLSGRVSFEMFSLDQGKTTVDATSRFGKETTFDNTYTFNVTANDSDMSIFSTQTFTILIVQRNIVPYENLYLKAFLTPYQRTQFQSIVQNSSVFPPELVYRTEDPYFGVSKELKTLFLPGLSPSLLETYANAVSTNHYTKRITLGGIKTAIATQNGQYDVADLATGNIIGTYQDGIGFIPTDFTMGYTTSSSLPAGTQLVSEHVKYEVIYAEVIDTELTVDGQGPANIQYNEITNPYYDPQGNAYTIAYPNAFTNMQDIIVNAIGYENKGALPDWMTSKQADGRILGFTRAVVLAYTKPGASTTIAYKFAQADISLNHLDFTVDRYQLDNVYSANYDITANAFITSSETTFDRFPPLADIFTSTGTVTYALSIPFDAVNEQSVTNIVQNGGLDGVKSFKDGDTVVFFQQEFKLPGAAIASYNDGWSVATAIWDIDKWDFDNNTPSNTSDDLGWDASSFVPGYTEYLQARVNNGTQWIYPVTNKRIGIWQISITDGNIVKLTFKQSIDFNNTLYVRNGTTYGSNHIYFDPVVKPGKTVPNYSVIPQQIKISSTIFDGNGTRFFNYRDSYSVPGAGDKYIKFAKTGVFT